MENREIARLLDETADLMEIAGDDVFRTRSYRNGASAIEGLAGPVVDLLSDPSRKLTEIPGIGKGLAHAIEEVVARGSCERRDALLERFPPTALEFLKIQGLGPKSLAVIFQHYRISTIDELERLAQEGKLRDLPRMGAKFEEKVLRSVAQYRAHSGRFLLSQADQVAGELSAWLEEVPGIERIGIAGSARRGCETVAGLDLLVTGSHPGAALDRFLAWPRVHEVLNRSENRACAHVGREGLPVDVRAYPGDGFAPMLRYLTGSRTHNEALSARAASMGFRLDEQGLFRNADGSLVMTGNEDEIYAALGLAPIPPELRENRGEIEAAASGTLPNLIDSVRGDLHMHTTETDGRGSLEEMAEAALALGYQYVAITDHSKALAMANGLDEKRVVDFARRVRELNRSGSLGIRIFSGLECDILKDGVLDIAADALAELDFVVASVHSYMNQEPAAMTDRLLRALESPSVRALGHPTGRILLHRDAFTFDFDRVVTEAVRRDVWLEINSSPERLDLNGDLIRTARSLGARFTISTDAHHPRHLSNIRYGLRTARRAWLGPGDVLNTLPVDEFAAALNKKRQP